MPKSADNTMPVRIDRKLMPRADSGSRPRSCKVLLPGRRGNCCARGLAAEWVTSRPMLVGGLAERDEPDPWSWKPGEEAELRDQKTGNRKCRVALPPSRSGTSGPQNEKTPDAQGSPQLLSNRLFPDSIQGCRTGTDPAQPMSVLPCIIDCGDPGAQG